MTRRRRSTLTHSLILVALAAAGCASGSDDPATSAAATSPTVPVTEVRDDFTDVPASDLAVATGSSPGDTVVAPADTVDAASDGADPAPAAATTSTSAPNGDAPSTETGVSDSVVAESESTTSSTSSTSPGDVATSSSSTSTTTAAGSSDDAAQNRALAAAFTAQLDADDVEELSEVFDTVCLGNEFVVAFGGAAAADADYSLNLTTVTAESGLFNDEPVSEQTAEAVVAALGRCGDVDDLLLLELGIGPEDAELGRCVVAEIADGLFEASLVEDYQQIDGPALEAFDFAADDAFDDCFD